MKDLIQQTILAQTANPNPGFFVSIGNNSPESIAVWIITTIVSLCAIIAVLFIIIGGFTYMTSAGNEERAKAGKKRVVNAIIGLIIIMLSYTIITVIRTTILKS
jgi:amino acid transporter